MASVSPQPQLPARFVTISKTDPDFKKWIDGEQNINAKRALPVVPLINSNQQNPSVTFELVSEVEIQKHRPSEILVWTSALRPTSWVLTLGPLLSVAAENQLGTLKPPAWKALYFLAMMAIIFLHAAIHLFDDYNDYLSGYGERGRGAKRVLAEGWLRAFEVQRVGWIFVSAAVLLGLVLLYMGPVYLIVIAFVTGLILLAVSKGIPGVTDSGWLVSCGWWMFGPLLSLGAMSVTTGQFQNRWLLLGVPSGFAAFSYLFLKKFEPIMADSLKGLETLSVKIGFDWSRRLALASLAGLAISWILELAMSPLGMFMVIPVGFLLFELGGLSLTILNLKSPLAGSMRGLSHRLINTLWKFWAIYFCMFLLELVWN